MALLIVVIFAGVWNDLLRFRRLALSQSAASGFAGSTSVPELGALASAFDEMVARLRRSATMIRQSAEDNAHAFKGPIATIRQAIEPLRRRAPPELLDFLRLIGALDRLDGLVQSARVLDSAAAELLDLQQSRVDFSGFGHGVDRQHGRHRGRRGRCASKPPSSLGCSSLRRPMPWRRSWRT